MVFLCFWWQSQSQSQHLHFHRHQGEALPLFAVLVVGLDAFGGLRQGFLHAERPAFEVTGEETLLGWDTING